MTKSRSDRLDAFDAVNLLCLTLALAKPRNLLAFWNGLARDVAFCAQGTGILFPPSILLILIGKGSVAASEE